MLPVDWAALFLLGLPLACLCFAGAPTPWAAIALVTGVGTVYIVARIVGQPRVALHERVQLAAASLVTIAATVAASVILFHPAYKWSYRPYPSSLYGWLAAMPLGVAWYASVRMIIWRRERRKREEGPAAVAPSVQD
jgi:hypothetical protein